ncbi:SET domain containing protein [Plasmodiophora brassicae]|uniref:Uncharacterized protein n=1 Tax=Plasmodiophora brassicae TaxID=37360 RepID=A0A0G4IS33_PLABS|nr:hypothetical protein PBRA_006267 [Plasmodiophora brassicae]SPQ96027.1 unnamed protein product [Plasmodiophora brassicae]
MSARCRSAASNGLTPGECDVLEEVVRSLEQTTPLDGLKAVEPLLDRLSQIQPPLQSPSEPSRAKALADLQQWFAKSNPSGGTDQTWSLSADVNGVKACRDLPAGSTFITVPKSMMVMATEPTIAIDAVCEKIPSVALTLQLIHERRVGGESRFAAYIASLPALGSTELDAAAFWPISQIKTALEPTTAYSGAIRTRLSTVQHYVYLVGYVVLPPGFTRLSWAEWSWASAIVLSRQNSIVPGTLALIPCWDMANHDPNGCRSFYNEDGNVLVSETSSSVAADDQIFINYGCRPAWQLVVYQGFVGSSSDCGSSLMRAALNDLQQPRDDIVKLRSMLLEKRDIANADMQVGGDGSVPDALLWAARINSLDRESAAIALRNPNASSVSPANERAALLSLFYVLSTRLEDREAVCKQNAPGMGAVPERRAHVAKMLTSMEISTLRKTIGWIQARIAECGNTGK